MPPPDSAVALFPTSALGFLLSPHPCPLPPPSVSSLPCVSADSRHSAAFLGFSLLLILLLLLFKLSTPSYCAHGLARPFDVTSQSCLDKRQSVVEPKILVDFGMLLPPIEEISYWLLRLSRLNNELSFLWAPTGCVFPQLEPTALLVTKWWSLFTTLRIFWVVDKWAVSREQ